MNPNGENPKVTDPDNKDVNYFSREVADRVPFMIRTLVYIWAVLVIIAVILINRHPKDHSNNEEQQRLNTKNEHVSTEFERES